MTDQRLSYLHENLPSAGLVEFATHYRYGSAINYYEEQTGLQKLELLSRRDSIGVGGKPDRVLVHGKDLFALGRFAVRSEQVNT